MPDLSTLTEQLAADIRKARDDAHLSQVELAERLGVSPRTLQNWEAGIGLPQPKHRRRLAAFLNNEEVAA
jgi:DNA-binding transcriptional regulator YiaG